MINIPITDRRAVLHLAVRRVAPDTIATALNLQRATVRRILNTAGYPNPHSLRVHLGAIERDQHGRRADEGREAAEPATIPTADDILDAASGPDGNSKTRALATRARSIIADLRDEMAGRGERAAIRDWASANGFAVAEHGMIPRVVVNAFRAAHSTQQQTA